LKHLAGKEAIFIVANVNPDFCEVDGGVVAFDIYQVLSSEHSGYSPDTFSRGAKVLHQGSIIKGVRGNAGKGVKSGVAKGSGDSIMIEGSERLLINGQPGCTHLHQADMNVKAG
jgi:hypothetical protein